MTADQFEYMGEPPTARSLNGIPLRDEPEPPSQEAIERADAFLAKIQELDPTHEWYPKAVLGSRQPIAPETEMLMPTRRPLLAALPSFELRGCTEPHLGLATTEELLRELESRGRVESVNFYQEAGRQLQEACERIRHDLPPEMRSYRTVDPR